MKKKALTIIITCAVVVVFAGIFIHLKDDNSFESVKIGAILPLTGKYADVGVSVQAGIELAVMEINDDTDRKYSVVYYDTESDAKQAALGFRRLRQMGNIEYFFTTTSDHALAIKPLAIQDSVYLFAVCSHLDVTKDNKQLIYRLGNTGIDEGKAILDYVDNDASVDNVALFSLNTEAGLVFEDFLKENMEKKIAISTLYDDDPSIARNLVQKVEIEDVDCVVVFGFSKMIGHIIKSLREVGYSKSIISNLGFYTPSVLATAGEYARSTYYIDYDLPYQSDAYKKKNALAETLFKTSFSSTGYMSYSATHLLRRAISGNGGGDMVKNFFSQNQVYHFDGATINTSQDGGITMPMVTKVY